MDSRTTVTAVVATNRIDQYLDEAIASLARVTYAAMDIVIVLDGLSSGSLPEWADNHTVLETGDHVGTAAALNLGIRNATGEYILRLDADDLCAEGRVESQVQYLDANPHVLAVGGGAEMIDEMGAIRGDMPRLAREIVDLRADLLRRNRFVHSTMCIRKSALDAVGGYNEECVRKQDYELWLRLGRLGELHSLPIVAAQYRVHANQSSKKSPVIARSTVEITRARFRLAKVVNVNAVRATGYSIVWIAWQVLRQLPAVKPTYTRRTRP